MIRRTPMRDSHSNSGIRGPETGTFIQCVNGREPKIHELWCWDIDVICLEVHPSARVDILDGTVVDFSPSTSGKMGSATRLSVNFYINGSVQFIGLSEIFLSFFRSGHRGPRAYSLLGGVVPSQSIG